MKHTCTYTHNLAWSLELNNVLSPQVPVQDSTGEIRPHDMAFLSPHEVLAIVAQHSSPDIIYDFAGLDPSGLCQVQVVLSGQTLSHIVGTDLNQWKCTVGIFLARATNPTGI